MERDFCEYCNSPLPDGEKLVTVYRHRRGQHFIFEHVPARVCPRCGERYFSEKAASEMGQAMRQPEPLPNLVSVPLIELPLAG
jgi:YgiT-type zinc finger domain-containing protein